MQSENLKDESRKEAVRNIQHRIRKRLMPLIWLIPTTVGFAILNFLTPSWFDTELSDPNPAFWTVMFFKIILLILLVIQIIYILMRTFFWESIVQREISRLRVEGQAANSQPLIKKSKHSLRLSDDGELVEAEAPPVITEKDELASSAQNGNRP